MSNKNNISSLKDLKKFAGKNSNSISFDEIMNEFESFTMENDFIDETDFYSVMNKNEVIITSFIKNFIKSSSIDKKVLIIWGNPELKSESDSIIRILENLLFIIISQKIKKAFKIIEVLKIKIKNKELLKKINTGIIISNFENNIFLIDWKELKDDLKEIFWLIIIVLNLFKKEHIKALNAYIELMRQKSINFVPNPENILKLRILKSINSLKNEGEDVTQENVAIKMKTIRSTLNSQCEKNKFKLQDMIKKYR